MAQDSDVDDFLSRMQGVGTLNSEGVFTLDGERAALLLDKFRLPSATYYMLHAVGAAVVSGASSVDMTLRSDGFVMDFDGDVFSTQDVADCAAALWSTERSQDTIRLQELAIARGGALEWGASEFVLEDRGERQRLKVTKRSWGAKLRRSLGSYGRQEEELLLRQHLCPTPQCQLNLNGGVIPSLGFPQQVKKVVVIGEVEPKTYISRLEQTHRLTGPIPECEGLICELSGNHAKVSAWQGDRDKMRRSYWPGFMDIVLNGRLYRCKMPAGWKHWWGIFWARTLRRDLSFSYLAESDLESLRGLFAKARDL